MLSLEEVLLHERVWNDLLQGSGQRAGVGEGRSWVVPAGQPPKMWVKVTNPPWVKEVGVRVGWELEYLTQHRETGTSPLPFPALPVALGDSSAPPGWTISAPQS